MSSILWFKMPCYLRLNVLKVTGIAEGFRRKTWACAWYLQFLHLLHPILKWNVDDLQFLNSACSPADRNSLLTSAVESTCHYVSRLTSAVFQALFGTQLIITMIAACVLQKLGPFYSLARWLLCSSGLVGRHFSRILLRLLAWAGCWVVVELIGGNNRNDASESEHRDGGGYCSIYPHVIFSQPLSFFYVTADLFIGR